MTNIFGSINKLYNPAVFQGADAKPPYFEGWYFKAETVDGRTLAFIPGISLTRRDPHCFLQILDSQSHKTYFLKYPLSDFIFSERELLIKAKDSFFSNKGMKIDIDDEVKVKGEIEYVKPVYFKSSLLSPGIMGPFGFMPSLECNHGITMIKSSLRGRIDFDGEEIDFDGGYGYIEKDWGRSFPKDYLWVQCSHFKDSDAVFMLSAALVPFGMYKMRGLISFLYYEGKLIRLTTYKGASLTRVKTGCKSIEITAGSNEYRLSMTIDSNEAGALKAPQRGEMSREVRESASARLRLELYSRHYQPIFSDESDSAGLEICGDITRLKRSESRER